MNRLKLNDLETGIELNKEATGLIRGGQGKKSKDKKASEDLFREALKAIVESDKLRTQAIQSLSS